MAPGTISLGIVKFVRMIQMGAVVIGFKKFVMAIQRFGSLPMFPMKRKNVIHICCNFRAHV
ncbi:hypothetical protein A9404_07865 [Halothiobacillus diazotrophicus]|uniref:Uncharacterized protein n=1 Tax=Halothiobacillus diazotrophicus TaxID=1860122 RepID=A0A191ZHG8_9GAMM|nr:hypothetical protein A9404_07865 [Halothiobacillus diazotrophicus]